MQDQLLTWNQFLSILHMIEKNTHETEVLLIIQSSLFPDGQHMDPMCWWYFHPTPKYSSWSTQHADQYLLLYLNQLFVFNT